MDIYNQSKLPAEVYLNGIIIIYKILEIRLINSQKQSLIQENNGLKIEIGKLNNFLSSKNQELEIYSNKELNFKNYISQYEERLVSKNKDIDLLKNELFSSHEKLKLSEDNNKNILKDNENLKLNIKKLEENLTAKDQEYLGIIKNLDNLRSANEKIIQDNMNIKNELVTFRIQELQYKNEISQLTQEIEKTQKNIVLENNNKEAQITYLNQKLKLSNEEIINNQQKFNQMLYELNSSNNNFSFELNKEKHRIKDYQNQLLNKDKEVNDSNELLSDANKVIYEREKQIVVLKDMLVDKEGEIKKVFELRQKLNKYTDLERNMEKNLKVDMMNNVSGSGSKYSNDYVKLRILYDELNTNYEEQKKAFSYYKDKIVDYENQKEKTEKMEAIINLGCEEVRNLQLKLEDSKRTIESEKIENSSLQAFAKKLSLQNRELLFQIKLKDGSGFLRANKSPEEYEKFIYKNIEELEMKHFQLLKENEKNMSNLSLNNKVVLKLQEENKDLLIKVESLEKTKEECQKYIEEISSNYDKSYKVNNYSVVGYKINNNFDMSIVREVEKKAEKFYQELQNANKKHEKDMNEYNQEILKLQNNIKNLTSDNFSMKNLVLEKENKINTLNNSLNNSELTIKSLQNSKLAMEYQNANLNHESNNLKKSLEILSFDNTELKSKIQSSVQENSKVIEETHKKLYDKIDNLINENNQLKQVINEIKDSGSFGVDQEKNKLKDVSKVAVEEKNVETHLNELIKSQEKIKEIENECYSYKLANTEQKCKIENLSTLLGISKSKIEALEYKNLYLDKDNQRYNNIEKDEYQYQVNTIPVYKPSSDPEDIETQNKKNFDEALYEKYLKALKNLENRSLELTTFKYKYKELQKDQENLLKNDPASNYKCLLNRIDEINHNNDYLNECLAKANLEKDEVIKEYYFIQRQSDNFEMERKKYEEVNSQILVENERLNKEINLKNEEINELFKNRMEDKNSFNDKVNEINLLSSEHANLKISYENLILEINSKKEEITKFLKDKDVIEEKSKKIKELTNTNQDLINQEQKLKSIIHELDITIKSKELEISTVKADYENKLKLNDQKIQNLLEEKVTTNKTVMESSAKDITDLKKNYFNENFQILKRARIVVETLNKTTRNLESKIHDLELEKNSNLEKGEISNLSSLNSQINESKIKNYEQKISNLKKTNKDLEDKYEKKIKTLTRDLGFYKEREKNFSNEVKTLNSFSQSMEDNSVPKDVKSNFIKMVNYLKISTHILNVKENIVQSLEGEIEKLKQMLDDKDTISFNKKCDNCNQIIEEKKLILDSLQSNKNKMDIEIKQVDKYKIEKNLVVSELKSFANVYQEIIPNLTGSSEQKTDILSNVGSGSNLTEKKNMNILVTSLRKATNLIKILQGKIETMSDKLKNLC